MGAAFARQHPDGKAVRGVHPRYGHATVTAPYCPLPTHSLGTPKTYRKRAWFWDREGPKLVPRGRRRTGHPDPLQQAGAAVPAGRGAVPKPHRGPFPPRGPHCSTAIANLPSGREIFNTDFFKSYIVKPRQAILSPESARGKPRRAVWMQSSTSIPQLGDGVAPACVRPARVCCGPRRASSQPTPKATTPVDAHPATDFELSVSNPTFARREATPPKLWGPCCTSVSIGSFFWVRWSRRSAVGTDRPASSPAWCWGWRGGSQAHTGQEGWGEEGALAPANQMAAGKVWRPIQNARR